MFIIINVVIFGGFILFGVFVVVLNVMVISVNFGYF